MCAGQKRSEETGPSDEVGYTLDVAVGAVKVERRSAAHTAQPFRPIPGTASMRCHGDDDDFVRPIDIEHAVFETAGEHTLANDTRDRSADVRVFANLANGGGDFTNEVLRRSDRTAEVVADLLVKLLIGFREEPIRLHRFLTRS